MSPDYLITDEGRLIAIECRQMAVNGLIGGWVGRWKLTPNLMVYVNKQRKQRRLVRKKIISNNNDCLRAFDFAVYCDDVKSLDVLLRNNKREIRLSYDQVYNDEHACITASLYESWIMNAIKQDSENVFEFLVQYNLLGCGNFGPIMHHIEKSGKIAPGKKDKYIAIVKKYDPPSQKIKK